MIRNAIVVNIEVNTRRDACKIKSIAPDINQDRGTTVAAAAVLPVKVVL